MKGAAHPPDAEARLETLARLLRHLGWTRALEKSIHPLVPGRAGAGAPAWATLFARDPEVPTVALLCPVEGELTPIRQLYTLFEDLGSEVRHLLSWWRENPPRPDWLLLTDGQRTLLFDPESEECLASSEEPTDLSETVLPHLNFRDVARGTLKEFPRRTSEDYGRELSAWIGHWTATLGASLKVERPNAQRLVEGVLLARLAERLGFAAGRPRIEDWTWAMEGTGTGADDKTGRGAGTSGGSVRVLRRFWHALEPTGFMRCLRLTDRQLIALTEKLTPSDLMDRCLASVSRLSWKRFRSEVFASALADEELRHKSWAAVVTGDTPALPGDVKQAEDPDRWLHTLWEIDLDQLGYPAVFRALNQVVDGLREYNLSQRAAAMRGDRAHLQLSLFDPEPDGLTASLSLSDPVAHALTQVIRVKTAVPERARMMRVVLTARALEMNESTAPLLNPIPDLRVTVPGAD